MCIASGALDNGQVGVALAIGHRVQIIRPLVGRIPRQLDQFDGLVVFGGPMSANDDHLQDSHGASIN